MNWKERAIVGAAICAAVTAACVVTGSAGPLWGLLALGFIY